MEKYSFGERKTENNELNDYENNSKTLPMN